MDLGEARKEVPVGGYLLDILATDLDSDRPVIIENQLGATDHAHLGQLLTYAAGLDGATVVWVTGIFRDAHRQALDWLNQRTGEDTQFFGVEVELWQIGDSPFAPYFKPVATPNEWRKRKNDAVAPTRSKKNPFPSCLCGCGELNRPGSRFNPGHDARLKSMLTRTKVGKSRQDDHPEVIIEACEYNSNLKVVNHTAREILAILGKDFGIVPEAGPDEDVSNPNPKP